MFEITDDVLDLAMCILTIEMRYPEFCDDCGAPLRKAQSSSFIPIAIINIAFIMHTGRSREDMAAWKADYKFSLSI